MASHLLCLLTVALPALWIVEVRLLEGDCIMKSLMDSESDGIIERLLMRTSCHQALFTMPPLPMMDYIPLE
ncbi:hypothetical protein STEG23_026571, partial [Scotinomys teguina]